MRKQLNYEWHWFWETGNGEMGNNGIHVIDICRWALGQNNPPPRALSIGGRFGFNDCGQTANTHIALFDYHPAPLICEIRNLSTDKKGDAIGSFRGRKQGVIIDCEGGYFAGDAGGGTIFDKEGKKVKELHSDETFNGLETAHLTSFAKAIRSRKTEDLAAEALEGYRSTACCHLANVSHRLGRQAPPDEIRVRTKSSGEFSDAFERCRTYLRENGVDLDADHATLGPWVAFDAVQGLFVGEYATEANRLSRRQYREPFVVPALT
jgi:predicted dehydrogenase